MEVVKLWKRKLKGIAFASMLGLQLIHGEAGDPLFAQLPKPVEPYAADYDRGEQEPVSVALEIRIPTTSPIVTGSLNLVGSSSLSADPTVTDVSYVRVYQ